MGLDFRREAISFALEFPLGMPAIILGVIYVGLIAYAVWIRREDFQKLNRTTWLMFGAVLIAIFPAHAFLILHRAQLGVLPTTPVGVLPSAPAISLLGSTLVMAVAIWLGPGPGLVANLVAGLAWVRFYPLTFTDLLALSTWGFAVGICLHQSYKGELFDMLRRPIVCLPLTALVPVFLFSLSRLAVNLPAGGLQAVDYMVTIWIQDFPLWLLTGAGLGLIFQTVFFNPAWRPHLSSDKVSVYSRSLRARLMILTIPLVILSIILSVLAVTSRAINLARDQSLAEMQRNAANAAEGISHFHYTGLNLLSTFAENPALLDPAQRQQTLEVDRQVVAFFQELLLVDATHKIVEAVPLGVQDNHLTTEELLLVEQASEFAISQVTHLMPLPFDRYGLTIVQPVLAPGESTPSLFLLGRVQLNINPEVSRALDALQATRGSGAGFILDGRGLIIAHPDDKFVLRPWRANAEAPRYQVEVGVAYDDVDPAGERVLTYILDVIGTPYQVVMQLPFTVVLETATFIASPLLLVQLLVSAILLVALPFFTARIIQPLNSLAEAANRIARGNLRIPVTISGEDEVAQLGRAFEQMRLRLRARLNDLSLLLNIAQSVSATLDLDRGVQPILEGALEETEASVARFILLRSTDRPERVYSAGDDNEAFVELDRAFAKVLTRRHELLVIQDLSQAQGTAASAGSLCSVAIFPVRIQNNTVAVFWIGSTEVNAFDDARVNFLSTLASQAAVLVQNARLFQSAEGGRRRLAAILASTTDAILVTDSKSRILLTNPAARQLLALDEEASGQSVMSLSIPESLIEALSRSDDEQQPPTVEVPFEDGRTFYASIAPIAGSEGVTFGKVVVLRDVTHFKELDEMKSEFVATVSHDLRAPLTFIRGYATMLRMVGDLNDKQHDYLERILGGIDQMSALIGDLLNLRRIEAGVGIRQEECRLGLILVEAVDTMRARATTKGITLRLEPTEGSPTVAGDRTLLRQAISNLVDNAIKYTPSGGQVSVGLDMTDVEAVIRITDTGIGIAPEDQVRLFEKFYRIKRRETGNVQGTGLGLALVKSIVERHNGRVWVESSLNQGSTFYVALPLPEQA